MLVKLGDATIRNRITGEGIDVTLVFDPSKKKDPYGVRFGSMDNTLLWYSSLPSPAAIRDVYDQSKV